MNDILFDFFTEELSFDLVVKNSEIQQENSLKSAVLISLFTDARCEKSELPSGEKSQRGFWGDTILAEKTGSKLWLLERAKYSQDTLLKAKEYAKKALDWLITDGLAKEVKVEASFNLHHQMLLNISILKNNGVFESIDISNLWDNL